jgi:hypothetical protein
MKNETLERLLLDRALGQLAPDLEELLEEQCAMNPAAARSAEEFAEAVTWAKRVITRPVRTAVGQTDLRSSMQRENGRRLLALAASFVLGAVITFCGMRAWMLPQRQVASAVPSARPAEIARLSPAPAVERAVRTLPFWSHERIYALASAARQASASEKQQ